MDPPPVDCFQVCSLNAADLEAKQHTTTYIGLSFVHVSMCLQGCFDSFFGPPPKKIPSSQQPLAKELHGVADQQGPPIFPSPTTDSQTPYTAKPKPEASSTKDVPGDLLDCSEGS